MCKPNAPNTSLQQAEAARQSAAEEARYQQQLAAQQAEWDRQRTDAETRYQQQLATQQAEIERQRKQQEDQAAATEAEKKKQIDDAAAATARGRGYTEYRDAVLDAGKSGIEGAYKGFDDAYFNNFANDFLAANRGDVDNQWERGKRSMKYKLADGRNLNSSAAADAFGEMDVDHNSAISKIAAAGSDKANQYKLQVDQQKNNSLNALMGLGNLAAPDFQSDEDAAAAKSRIAKTVMSMSQQQPAAGF